MNILHLVSEILLEEGYSDTKDAHGMGFDYFRSVEIEKHGILRAFREGSGGGLVTFTPHEADPFLVMETKVKGYWDSLSVRESTISYFDPNFREQVLQFLREVK